MLVVDAYNVTHVTGVLPPDLAGPEPADLADLIAGSRWGRQQVVLVCDGTRPKGAPERGHGTVRIQYAGGGVSADAVIERMLEQSSHPRRMTVVSNDHAVQRAARRRRAQVLGSDAFLRQLAWDFNHAPRQRRVAVRRQPDHLTPAQVDAWLRYFGIEP